MNEKPILLVEDHPDDEFLTLHTLKKNRMSNVIVIREAQEALNYLFSPSAKSGAGGMLPLEFILLDLRLPKMDGFEFLEILRGDERTKEIPVVILSSSQQVKDVDRSRALGVSAYLNKPLDNHKIMQLMSSLQKQLPTERPHH